MAREIEAGRTIDAAFTGAAAWLPLPDRLMLSASSQAGRTPHALKNLATRHAQLGAVQLRLALACLYPLGVLHAGLLLLPVVRMIDWEKGFTWDGAAYARMVALTLGSLWAVIVALGILIWRQNPLVLRVARLLPFIGGYIRKQGLADFAFALGNFLDAGVLVGTAWSVTGTITPLPQLKKAAGAMHRVIEAGGQPGTQLAKWPCFPPDFVALYHTGETTGQLEQNLLRLAAQYQDSASRSLTFATLFYPAMLFAIVAVMVVFHIFKIYAGYLKMLEKSAS